MKYIAAIEKIEDCSSASLGGVDLMLFSLNGRAHVVPADVFHLFFASEPTACDSPIIEAPRRTVRKAPRKQARSNASGITPARQAILDALKEAPRTSGEVKDVLKLAGFSPASAYDLVGQMSKESLIEKRQCPQSRLDKWYPKALA